ncbi:MAG: hypothetical protein RLO51_13165 [Thalassobaculum sp.]|uniref:hypothetical protein n=1 Tax=Thalassobaculum sp. TaxID=2022740 RepID=UPI0032EC93F7
MHLATSEALWSAGGPRFRPLRLMAPLAAVLAAAAWPALAAEWDFSGSLQLETRVFPSEPAHAGQKDATLSPSVAVEPELIVDTEAGADRFTLKPFLRLDADDGNRSHGDLREANWLHFGDGYDLVVGLDKVFWGVAESRHLVDIVNQADLVEDIDQEDKLGQPMVQLQVGTDWGVFRGFLMPVFRERTFPDDDARFRGPLPIAGDAAYQSDAGEFHPDLALRWTRTFGGFDVGISHFRGTSREPRLVPTLRDGRTELLPTYDLIDQTGVDLQYTTGAWLWKVEGIGRAGQGDYFVASVAGFEYTLYQVAETDADLGLLLEYLYDGREESGDAPPTPFQNDVFVGARVTLNDEDDTTFLAGAVADAEDRSVSLSLEASRRIGNDLKVELEARLFPDVEPGNALYGIRRDNVVTLRLSRFF